MFTRILVAVAADEIVDQLVATAATLAGTLGAQVALVHVADVGMASLASAAPIDGGASMIAATEVLEAEEQSGKALLDRLATSFPQGKAETMLYEGVPADAIVNAAREWHADLIIAGTHGRGGLERLILGSVTESILRHAPCPVLALPYKAATT